MRTSLLIISAGTVLLLAGCSGSAATPPSQSPSTPEQILPSNANPSSGGRNAVEGPCPSRATAMTSAEAKLVAGDPLTGESWLPTPKSIGAPAASVAVTTWSDSAEWFEVGARNGSTILAMYDFMQGVQLVEQAEDGNLTWIANPFPADAAGPAAWTLDGITENAEQCYESLAVPTAIPLADGVVATVTSATNAVLPTSTANKETVVETLGGAQLYRLSDPYPLPDLVDPGAYLPNFSGVTYAMKMAFGGWLQLAFNPLSGAETVTGTPGLTDYFDNQCGDSPVYQSLVPPGSATDWTVVGKLDGRDVAIATASNLFAIERYGAYAHHFVLIGDTESVAVDFQTFLAAPGVVALRADEGGWWAQINSDMTPRAWC